MKKIIAAAALLLTSSIAIAQGVPQRINYQAVAIDADGDPIPGYDMVGRPIDNAEMDIRLTVLDGSPSGAERFKETHTVRTDAYGLFTLEIGGGTLISGDFATINWADSDRFLRVEMDRFRNGNWTLLGVQKMLTVPYSFIAERALKADFADQAQQAVQSTFARFSDTAFFAATSANASHALSADTSTWAVNVINNNDNDADSTNELQVLTRSNDTIYLSQGGFVVLPSDQVNDADSDSTNELQSLTLSGRNLSISQGNTVPLPADSNTTYTLTGYTTGGSTGYLIQLEGSDSVNHGIRFNAGPGINLGGSRNNYTVSTTNAVPSQAGSSYGDMLFWNGTQWTTVPVGNPGDILTLDNNKKPTWRPRSYQIGDTAFGGMVFYVDPSGQHGLVVSFNDLAGTGNGWGCYCTSVSTDTALYSGALNTSTMISTNCEGNAFSLVASYSSQGFGNWYLPSLSELKRVYQNVFITGKLTNFLPATYWTSSGGSYGSCGLTGGAYLVNFSNGTSYSDYRSGYGSIGAVRAIRSF
jgi:hypothetical protein